MRAVTGVTHVVQFPAEEQEQETLWCSPTSQKWEMASLKCPIDDHKSRENIYNNPQHWILQGNRKNQQSSFLKTQKNVYFSFTL